MLIEIFVLIKRNATSYATHSTAVTHCGLLLNVIENNSIICLFGWNSVSASLWQERKRFSLIPLWMQYKVGSWEKSGVSYIPHKKFTRVAWDNKAVKRNPEIGILYITQLFADVSMDLVFRAHADWVNNINFEGCFWIVQVEKFT